MLGKLIFKIAYWKWKIFDAPNLIKTLRSEGKHKEANALEQELKKPAPRDQDDMIQSTKQKLIAQGKYDEAIKFEKMAKIIKRSQKHGDNRP